MERTARASAGLVFNDSVKVRQVAQMTIDWMKIVKEKNPASTTGSQTGAVFRSGAGGMTASRRGRAVCHHRLCPEG